MRKIVRRFRSDNDKDCRSGWGAVSGGFFLISILLSAVVIWSGLMLDFDNMTLSEAAIEIQTQNTLQMWAVGLIAAGVAFYVIASHKQASCKRNG